MPAGARIFVQLPTGEHAVLSQGKGDAFGVQFINRDGSKRDLTSDSLSVDAKLDAVAKTLVFAADSPATDGRATLTIPAAQLDTTGTLYVDLKWAKSGGEANVVARLKFTVEASDAG